MKKLSTLINKLDRVFSEYVRRKDADEGGTNACVTCGRLAFWRDLDCGHYVKRQHLSLRFDLRNVAPQCKKCNRFAGGMMDEFAFYIVKTYGADTLRELIELKHKAKKWTHDELQELINKYQGLIKEMA